MTGEELIAALEAAECGSRELSDEMLLGLGWIHLEERPSRGYPPARVAFDGEGDAKGYWSDRPSPSESVDEALALVPATLRLLELREAPWRQWYATLCEREGDRIFHAPDDSGHATPALALCANILRAHQ